MHNPAISCPALSRAPSGKIPTKYGSLSTQGNPTAQKDAAISSAYGQLQNIYMNQIPSTLGTGNIITTNAQNNGMSVITQYNNSQSAQAQPLNEVKLGSQEVPRTTVQQSIAQNGSYVLNNGIYTYTVTEPEGSTLQIRQDINPNAMISGYTDIAINLGDGREGYLGNPNAFALPVSQLKGTTFDPVTGQA